MVSNSRIDCENCVVAGVDVGMRYSTYNYIFELYVL